MGSARGDVEGEEGSAGVDVVGECRVVGGVAGGGAGRRFGL